MEVLISSNMVDGNLGAAEADRPWRIGGGIEIGLSQDNAYPVGRWMILNEASCSDGIH